MRLDPLVRPRSVAIVGATDRGGPGRAVMELLGAIGFTGPIYPVNPKYQTVLNLTCYPSLTDLPEAPDIVVFSIRNPLIPEQMRLARQARRPRGRHLRQRLCRTGRRRRQAAGRDRRPGARSRHAGVRSELHGHSQSAGAGHHLQAEHHGSDGHRRQRRNSLAERLGVHRTAVRPAPLRRQPVGLRRQRGGDQDRRLPRLSDRRSEHQSDRDIHRNGARTRTLCRSARSRRRRRQAGRRHQGRTQRTHATRYYQPHRRPCRLVARLFRTAARPSRDRGQRSRRNDRGPGGLPGQTLAARPRHFGHHRFGRAFGADPRQRHSPRSRPAAAFAGRARRGGACHRPHHRRRQSVRRLGQRQLRRQSAARHGGGR